MIDKNYRRTITVNEAKEALRSIENVGKLLNKDHFIYQCIIDALNQRMNTTIEAAFSDEHIFEVFTIEFLLECVKNGDYVAEEDVLANLKDCKARDFLLKSIR